MRPYSFLSAYDASSSSCPGRGKLFSFLDNSLIESSVPECYADRHKNLTLETDHGTANARGSAGAQGHGRMPGAPVLSDRLGVVKRQAKGRWGVSVILRILSTESGLVKEPRHTRY